VRVRERHASRDALRVPALPFLLLQKRAQNQRRGDLVDQLDVLLPGVARLIENLVRLLAGQSLVPQMDGQPGHFAQLGGERLSLGGLRAQLSGEVQGIPHHDSDHRETPRQARQAAQILARIAVALQGQDRLHGDAQLVADGNADALVAYVERQVAGMGSGFQFAVLVAISSVKTAAAQVSD